MEQLNIFELKEEQDTTYTEIEHLLREVVVNSNTEEHELFPTEIQKGYSYRCYRRVWLWVTKTSKEFYTVELSNLPSNMYERIKAKNNDAIFKDGKIKCKTAFPVNLLSILKDELIDSYNYARCHEPVEFFGCCSHNEECTAAGKCVHKDIKFAKGCAYKKNLDKGLRFYK